MSSGPLTDWTGGPPIAAHEAVSSGSSISGSSGSGINGDSGFVHFVIISTRAWSLHRGGQM